MSAVLTMMVRILDHPELTTLRPEFLETRNARRCTLFQRTLYGGSRIHFA